MNETDKKIYDPLKKGHDKRHSKVHGKTIEDCAPPGFFEKLGKWIVNFEHATAAVGVVVPVGETPEAAVQLETYYRVSEMSYATLLATVRHPDVRDELKPRIGAAPEEHLENMLLLRKRLDDNSELLKERKIVLKLDKIHETPAVHTQAEKHRVATVALDARSTDQTAQSARVQQLRAEGAKLQKKLNKLLELLFDEDRASMLEHGYTERETGRKPAKAEAKKDDKQKKDDKAEPPKDAKPAPTPGPVAGGSAGTTPPPASPSASHETPPPEAGTTAASQPQK